MTKQKTIKSREHINVDDKHLYLRLLELSEEFSDFASLHQDDLTDRISHSLKALAKEMNFNRCYS